MFRSNFQRTGVEQATGIRNLTGIKWKFQQSSINTSFSFNYNLSISLGNGVICTCNNDGDIYGLNASTGIQLWRYQLGKDKAVFSPTILNEVVYIIYRDLNTVNRNEHILAINLRSGELKWQFIIELQPSVPNFTSMFSYCLPVINNEIMYIGGSSGRLYALNINSGQLIWDYKITQNMSMASPAIKEALLYICSSDGYLYALNTINKEQKWKFEIGPFSLTSSPCPAIANEKIYIVSSNNTLHALNIETGEDLWNFNIRNLPFSFPAITKRIVCIHGGENYFYALESETGQQLWSFKANDKNSYSNPIIAEQAVYFGSQEFLKALDLETGKQLWQFEIPLSDRWMLNPQKWLYGIANQLIKIFTDDEHLEKFSEPVVADGVIYVSCSNGYVYALH